LTPDDPESSPPVGGRRGDESSRSRADRQAELRRTRKEELKHRHRWRRRGLVAASLVILVAALGAVGLYYYANYRFDQIKKVHSKHLVDTAALRQQKPFNILLVGSDSRAFVDNSTQANAFGTQASNGGQRSDVTMVARFDPKAKTVTLLSIPRDLWVDIPGNSSVAGPNRINAAFDSGPDLLIQTIETDLGIPISHYIAVNFPGFSGMVDALGGVTMDFPTEVKDQFTGLDVTTTGCQVVNGTTALELVRSRHLFYMNSGYWTSDGLSDFSRIQRQDAFFRAVLKKAGTIGFDPIAINNFVSAAVTNLTIDDTLSKGDLITIANDFKGLPPKHLFTETLPTIGYVTDGGADVLKEAQPFAQDMIDAFNKIGTTPPPTTTTTTTTTTPPVPRSQVGVDVLNASTVAGLAHTTAAALRVQGFVVDEIGDATTPLPAASPSEIRYGPLGRSAAATLASALGGPVTQVADPTLSGQTVTLEVASSQLTVSPPGVTPAGPGATSTTTTTTTIPPDVYTNTQPEPWNPFPCTLGQPTQASPTTTTPKKKH
jgi:LCP family protein required for cell wall assembly